MDTRTSRWTRSPRRAGWSRNETNARTLGFDLASVPQRRFGLVGMRERVAVHGGELDAGATIPLARTDVSFDIVGTLGTLLLNMRTMHDAGIGYHCGKNGLSMSAVGAPARHAVRDGGDGRDDPAVGHVLHADVHLDTLAVHGVLPVESPRGERGRSAPLGLPSACWVAPRHGQGLGCCGL